MRIAANRFVTGSVTGCDRKFLANPACVSVSPSVTIGPPPAATPVQMHAECVSHEAEQPEIKIGWGGARRGAGRKRKCDDPPVETEIVGLRWYGIETEFRAEYDVFGLASSLGFRCWLGRYVDPTAKSVRYPRRQVIRLLIAGFVFVQFDRSLPQWRRLASVTGVKRLLGPSSERPTPARIGEVERLIELGRAGDGVIDDDATPFPTGRARVGDAVTIEAGPFASFTGICTWSDKARLRILTEIFGRSSTIELEHHQVTRS